MCLFILSYLFFSALTASSTQLHGYGCLTGQIWKLLNWLGFLTSLTVGFEQSIERFLSLRSVVDDDVEVHLQNLATAWSLCTWGLLLSKRQQRQILPVLSPRPRHSCFASNSTEAFNLNISLIAEMNDPLLVTLPKYTWLQGSQYLMQICMWNCNILCWQ